MTTTAIDILERESATGTDHADGLEKLLQKKSDALTRYEQLKEQWHAEKDLIAQIRNTPRKAVSTTGSSGNSASPAKEDRMAASRWCCCHGGRRQHAPPEAAPPLSGADRKKLVDELAEVNRKLAAVQGESPLLQACVDSQAVAEIVASWTGIPVGRMVSDEIQNIIKLNERMEERVVGQSHGLEAIAQRIRTSRANLTDPSRPIGVFFLVGPKRRGKDGDRHCTGRIALWWRAEYDHDQHVGIQGRTQSRRC